MSEYAGQFVFNIKTSSSGTSGVYHMSDQIPKQLIYLQSYKIEMKDAATSLAKGLLRVEFPWLNASHLLDDQPTRSTMILECDNSAVTFRTGLYRPIPLSQHINQNFPFAIYDEDNNLMSSSDLIRLTLHFSFQTIYKNI